MDNLTACSIAAEKMGISYGQYMALQDRKPIVIEEEPKPEPGKKVRYCKVCGKPIRPEDWRMSFCSDFCRRVRQTENARNCARRKRGISPDDVLICLYCGNEFLRGDRHGSVKFCSDECRDKRATVYRNKKRGL